MNKSTLKWLVLAVIIVCGMLGYGIATRAPADGEKKTAGHSSGPKFGVVTAILYSEDTPVVIIEGKTLHKGDTIHDVKVLDIRSDKVLFGGQDKQWEQKVNEPAMPEWQKKKGWVKSI
ncbi:MAG: hypothetical protein ABSG82_01525 [Sedimentisphaerales bacterium]|jgi:hypothetical protein